MESNLNLNYSSCVQAGFSPLFVRVAKARGFVRGSYDEAGGLYDHVPPLATVNPDGMAPKDLQPGDICAAKGGSNCDFNYTGFRVPLIVISAFAKKNYVSHAPADYTAILKFIEKRFLNGTSLTLRDAAQIDMTEFFDFQGVPWATAPTPPLQATNGACNAQTLR